MHDGKERGELSWAEDIFHANVISIAMLSICTLMYIYAEIKLIKLPLIIKVIYFANLVLDSCRGRMMS